MIKQMQPFSELIEQRLLELNSNAFAVEQAAGLPPDAIRNVIRSKTKDGPNITRAREICDALGLDFHIGRKKSGPGFAEPEGGSDLGKKEALRAGFLPIPWHPEVKIRGSAPVAFSQSWLAAEGLISDFLQAVTPDFSRLSYAIAKNTVAVIDTNSPRKGFSGIWCYLDGTAIGLGRAAFNADFTVLLPAEESGEIRIVERPLPSTFKMLGRVVWLGTTVNVR